LETQALDNVEQPAILGVVSEQAYEADGDSADLQEVACAELKQQSPLLQAEVIDCQRTEIDRLSSELEAERGANFALRAKVQLANQRVRESLTLQDRLQEDLDQLQASYVALEAEAKEMREELRRCNNTRTHGTQTTLTGQKLDEQSAEVKKLKVMPEEASSWGCSEQRIYSSHVLLAHRELGLRILTAGPPGLQPHSELGLGIQTAGPHRLTERKLTLTTTPTASLEGESTAQEAHARSDGESVGPTASDAATVFTGSAHRHDNPQPPQDLKKHLLGIA